MRDSSLRTRLRTWKMKLSGCLIDYISHWLFRTCRIEIEGAKQFIEEASKGSAVLIFWHDCLFAMAPILSRVGHQFQYTAFVSASRDGVLLQKICQRYSACEIIAVSHDKRHQALRNMVQKLQDEKRIILLTPDGPRGPRHVIKPGLFFAARKTGAPVVAMNWSASKYWELRSWDRLKIPKPFSRITVRFSAPIVLEQEVEDKVLTELLEGVQG